MPTILTISGSLRSRSSNTELLKAVAMLAPPAVRVTAYAGLGDLPHFNPDLDHEGATPPPAVRALRAAVAAADAIFISSPEYAHGVAGSLKNALDWLVSGSEIVGKRVALLNSSARSVHAHAQLAETLRTMSTIVVEEASLTVPLGGRPLDAAEIAADPELARILRRATAALTDLNPARDGH